MSPLPLDPYPRYMSHLDIYKKKFNFLRVTTLVLGITFILCAVLCMFLVGGVIPAFLFPGVALIDSFNFLAAILAQRFAWNYVIVFAWALAHIALWWFSRKNEKLMYVASALFIIDSVAVLFCLNVVSIIWHVIGLIIYVEGIFDTKKYIKCLSEKQAEELIETDEKPFDPYPFTHY